MTAEVPTLVITGPVGVGKTSVAAAISELLAEAGTPHAMVDMDCLRWLYPSVERFNVGVGLQNLAAVWTVYRAAGAGRLVLADVVESRADVAAYEAAVPGAAVQVVRLYATLPTILDRLRGREVGASLAWHAGRAAELLGQMERDQGEDLWGEAEHKSAVEIAREVLLRSRWPGA